MIAPTKEQELIIDSPGSIVIIANPGSGKTYVLAEKIKKVLSELKEYQGIIAISYTNKASQELKKRCLNSGINPKSSFFGTIDKFCISEIILPFAGIFFGQTKSNVSIVKQSDLSEENTLLYTEYQTHVNGPVFDLGGIDALKRLYLNGVVVLESVGTLALYIFDNKLACKKYIKAKYTHIVIDEYQDSGIEQHLLFLRIKDLGLTGIAVGDANQSIFKFSGKSSDHLLDLATKQNDFTLLPLVKNHRCDPSIINYSRMLLGDKSSFLPSSALHVHEKKVIGKETDIANWLNNAISKYTSQYGVDKFSNVGILVRSGRTGSLINQNLNIPRKFFENTPLDDDFTIWSEIFREALSVIFNTKSSQIYFIEKYIDVSSKRHASLAIIDMLKKIKKEFSNEGMDVTKVMTFLEKIANYFSPSGYNKRSLYLLSEVISNPIYLDSYKPANEDEVQIMTLHKSKGLEFDIVFHLDLYDWILPRAIPENYAKVYPEYNQDLNLHYVGITRARKCCVLCHSSQRTNYQNLIKTGSPSEFLTIKSLSEMRASSPF
ncbi:UvrD-helicase domain-containing protein [Chitinophaga caseinilytica]|uniref:UvrD-helicase domain-containing protein n=1 Tax=Chitinophaga caseinilytica TaxID=2267521 RepID=UPI003C302D19